MVALYIGIYLTKPSQKAVRRCSDVPDIRLGSVTRCQPEVVVNRPTGRIISCAALIMACVFFSFLVTPGTTIKMLALGLGVSVLIDATIVRLVIVPCAMFLLGRVNWWTPRWLDRVLPHLNDDSPVPRQNVIPSCARGLPRSRAHDAVASRGLPVVEVEHAAKPLGGGPSRSQHQQV